MAEGHPQGPKAPSSRSERAARRAEKMRARSARFFSYLKLEVWVCGYVDKIMNKMGVGRTGWGDQVGLCTLSAHYEHTMRTLSAHYEHTLRTLSAHYAHTKRTPCAH